MKMAIGCEEWPSSSQTHLCSKVRPRIFPSRIPGNYTCVAVAKELENLGLANDTRSVD